MQNTERKKKKKEIAVNFTDSKIVSCIFLIYTCIRGTEHTEHVNRKIVR